MATDHTGNAFLLIENEPSRSDAHSYRAVQPALNVFARFGRDTATAVPTGPDSEWTMATVGRDPVQ